MTESPEYNYQKVALEFTEALTDRNYRKAYEMTTDGYKGRTTMDDLKSSFESIVPPDWGPMGPIEVGTTMTDWPDKKSNDLGWVYVSIGGDEYSEAIIAIVALEGHFPKIREIEFGRP